MKRRRLLQTLAAAPAAPALLAQQAAAPVPPPQGARTMGAEMPKLDLTPTDEAADTVQRFFTAQQFATLHKLAELIMPPLNGAPGAVDAKAPEFLDFLIGESPSERQKIYRTGLDTLNNDARRRFGRGFPEVDDTQAATLLAPLRQSWTFDMPQDPLAAFLRVVKNDIRTATMNSKEFNTASASGGGRRFGGSGLYWHPIE